MSNITFEVHLESLNKGMVVLREFVLYLTLINESIVMVRKRTLAITKTVLTITVYYQTNVKMFL